MGVMRRPEPAQREGGVAIALHRFHGRGFRTLHELDGGKAIVLVLIALSGIGYRLVIVRAEPPSPFASRVQVILVCHASTFFAGNCDEIFPQNLKVANIRTGAALFALR
jgi:hypothetical protein